MKLDESPSPEDLLLARQIVSAWENQPGEIKKLRAQIKPKIVNLNEFKTYKSIWVNPDKHPSEKLMRRWEREQDRLIDQIIINIYENVKSDKSDPFRIIARRAISKIRSEMRPDCRFIEAPESARQMCDRKFVDQISPKKLPPPFEAISPMTADDRKKKTSEAEVEKFFKEMKNFFDNVETTFGKKLSGDLDWRRMMEGLIRKESAGLRENYTNWKSVYTLAKENKISNYRKLLYTLRQINFPIIKKVNGRRGHYILQRWLPLFQAILPRIKTIWEQKDNLRNWINHFRKEKKWSKSRTSKFMSRKIRRGLLPPCFFELTEPSILKTVFDHSSRNDTSFKRYVESSPMLSEVYGPKNTFKSKLSALKLICTKSQETLLTHGVKSSQGDGSRI